MKPATLPPAFEEALSAFRRAHGVVHYFVFEASGLRGLELHRTASLAAFEALRALLERSSFHLTIEPARMSATETTVEAFLGEARPGTLTSPRAFLEERERELSLHKAFSADLEPGYLHAFVDPPYGLRLSPEKVQRIFDTLNEHLFGGFTDDLEIFRWSTDWSNFFADGLEWWGAYWWTIHDRTRGIVSVLAASATD